MVTRGGRDSWGIGDGDGDAMEKTYGDGGGTDGMARGKGHFGSGGGKRGAGASRKGGGPSE